MLERYDRQQRIEIDGEQWEQDKLSDATVALVGSSTLAQNVACALLGLGIGRLHIYDNRRIRDGLEAGEFLPQHATGKHAFVVEALDEVISGMNPLMDVSGHVWKFIDPASTCALGEPEIIIDAANDPYTERVLLEYGRSKGIPVLNASAKRHHCELLLEKGEGNIDDKVSCDYYGIDQDPLMSGLIAGIAADELRKVLMPLGTEKPISKPVTFNTLSNNFLGIYDDLSEEEYAALADKYRGMTAAVIGAGALGNNVVLALAQLGVKRIELYDFDHIEESNLARQVMFTLHDSPVGKGKAEVLKDVVSKLFPKTKIVSYNKPFEGTFSGRSPDVLFRCTDNWESTKSINEAALNYGIPAVFMGTDPTTGQAYLFNPGENYCFECMFGVDAQIQANVKPVGCAVAPDASVITTNMVASYLGMALFQRHLGGHEVPANIMRYDNHKVEGRLYYPFTEYAPEKEGECKCHLLLS